MHSFVIKYNKINRRQKTLQLRERILKVYKSTLDKKHFDILDSMHAFVINYNEISSITKNATINEANNKSIEENSRQEAS